MIGNRILQELLVDIQELIDANIDLHKHFSSPTGHSWAQWSDYRKWINYNIGTIQTVKELGEANRYRDCYVLLRSVLEAYMLIKLSTLARVSYFDLLPIKDPKTGKEKPQDLLVRAKTFAAKDPNIKSFKLIHEKGNAKRYFVRILINIQPVGNTQVFVPMHYFYLRDYDPEGHYLSHLVSRNSWEGSKWDTKKHHKNQKDIKKTFLELDQLFLFMEINKFATPRQIDAILTHYNFLSKYTHSTPTSYEELNSRGDISHLDNMGQVFKEDRNHKVLCGMYAVYMALYFLELQLDYFCKEPDLLLDKKHAALLKVLRRKIKQKYSFFWFIYEKPQDFDVFMYKLKKQKLSPKKTPNIPYYVNPLVRLKNMVLSHFNKMIGHYKPPKILLE